MSECGWKILERWFPNRFAFSLSVITKELLEFNNGGTKSLFLVLVFINFHNEPLVGVCDDKNEWNWLALKVWSSFLSRLVNLLNSCL